METIIKMVAVVILFASFSIIIMTAQRNSTMNTTESLALSNYYEFMQVERFDLRTKLNNIGKNVFDPDHSILSATANKITFLTDVNNDTKVDTVTIYSKNLPNNNYDNQNLIELCEKTNNSLYIWPFIGFTQISFTYFDKNLTPTLSLNKIKFVGFTMEIQSKNKVNNKFIQLSAEERLQPKNIWKY